MELDRYLEDIHAQLDSAAQAGGDQEQEVARRLSAPLDAAVRLALLDALAAAAEEITVELAPGSVELRLQGREPRFAVTPPPADPSAQESAEDEAVEWWRSPEGEEGVVARFNLRLPEQLKARVEVAADTEGVSINAWLVRAAAARLDQREGPQRRVQRAAWGAQRYQGWAR
jgi:hypothetical protein